MKPCVKSYTSAFMEALSKTVKTCCEALGVQSNVFSHLLEKVAKSAPGVLDQLLCHNYESRIYCFLSQTLRHIDPLGFDSLIADYIAFVRSEHTYDLRFYLVFTEICINTILYWVFARRAHPVFVQKLLENTILYLSDKDSLLALIWRTFTPVYNPSPFSGVTPLHYVAQTRQSNILKVLLQFGILEREHNPTSTIFIILFYPTRVRMGDDSESTDIIKDAELCLGLCIRVLCSIHIAQLKALIGFRQKALISNWLDCIPATRYREPCELLHLCRVSIRSHLLTNNKLPAGIFLLPVPTMLQNYLNLET